MAAPLETSQAVNPVTLTARKSDGSLVPVQVDANGALFISAQAGSAVLGKVSIDQTTPGTTNLVQMPTAGYAARVQVTRPSDTTSYGAGDVVGVTGGGTACITFPNMGAGAGEVMITSTRFQRNATALISGETSYTLHLFSIAQPAAQVDNAVFDIAAGDQASYLGSINLGTPVDIGSTLAIEQTGVNKQVTLASSSLFGVLVTVGAYQPVSAAVHVVELHSVAL